MRFGRMLVLLCAALALAAPARAAESLCYAGFFDDYYHAAGKCALAANVSSVSLKEAEGQGKLPCPACVDDAASYKGVEATERGGTLVIRVPDKWMEERPAGETEDNFKHYWSGEFTGREADLLLSEQLHGAAYRELLASLEDDAPIHRAISRVPDIELDAGTLLMNRRHIGAAWLLTYRPDENARQALEKDGRLQIPLYFTVNQLTLQKGALNVFAGGLWQDGEFEIKRKKSKNETRFEAEFDSLRLQVFRDMDVNICVLHLDKPDPDRLAGASLVIDGTDRGIRMDGYDAGGHAVYCCALTDGEVRALENGAVAAIE